MNNSTKWRQTQHKHKPWLDDIILIHDIISIHQFVASMNLKFYTEFSLFQISTPRWYIHDLVRKREQTWGCQIQKSNQVQFFMSKSWAHINQMYSPHDNSCTSFWPPTTALLTYCSTHISFIRHQESSPYIHLVKYQELPPKPSPVFLWLRP